MDLTREAALQRVLVDGIASGLIRSAHDCAEGGVAVTLAECCFETGFGVRADLPATVLDSAAHQDVATLFGESASRAVVSVAAGDASALIALAAAAGLPAHEIGTVGGGRIEIAVDGRTVVDELLDDAERLWSTSLDRYFERNRAIA